MCTGCVPKCYMLSPLEIQKHQHAMNGKTFQSFDKLLYPGGSMLFKKHHWFSIFSHIKLTIIVLSCSIWRHCCVGFSETDEGDRVSFSYVTMVFLSNYSFIDNYSEVAGLDETAYICLCYLRVLVVCWYISKQFRPRSGSKPFATLLGVLKELFWKKFI